MKLVVTADARAFRGAIGLTAWAVLEELLLDAHIDTHGTLAARTNVRRLAAQLGMSKDTAARALNRLARAGVVHRVVAERGARGALPTSSYRVDLAHAAGVNIDAHEAATASTAIDSIDSPQRATRRRTTRPATLTDHAQTSLFDLPASVS